MSKVEYTLQRMDYNKSTYGILYNENGEQVCFVIEDAFTFAKIQGMSRIPAGSYRLKPREVLSPLTEIYRNKYDWFEWHLELQEVPEYTNVYIHIGNRHQNTDGCLLANNGVRKRDGAYVGIDSTSCFKDLYLTLTSLLESGNEVWINIRDEEYLKQPF